MRCSLRRLCLVALTLLPLSAWAGTAVPFTINLSKAVNVVTSGGTPRIAVDVAGTTRYANYTSGSGTSALVFTYNMVAGDVDLDGVAVSSPVQLNGGTIKDLSGNPLTNLTFTPPNTAGVKVNYPSLGMDFTNGAGGRYTLNGTPYTTLASFLTAAGGSFTRASVGTYFDSAGVLQTATANTPRLDYDPITHAAKGILIEEARTNLLTQSTTMAGIRVGTGTKTLSNDFTAPDGTSQIAKLVPASGQTLVQMFAGANAGSIAVTASTPYTETVYFHKQSSAYSTSEANMRVRLGGNVLNSPFVTDYLLSSLTPASPYYVGNGWYRLPYKGLTSPNAAIEVFISVDYINGATASGADAFYFFGAQLEQGAFATSYIPTTTAAVTRAADNFTVPLGSWFDKTKGTLDAEGIAVTNGTSNSHVITSAGSFSGDGIAIRQTVSPAVFLVGREPSNPSFDTSTAGISLNTLNKYVGAYAEGGTTSFSINGLAPLTGGTFGTGFGNSYTTLGVGRYPDATSYWNGYIKKLKYYPARVPNTQLQLMTQ